MEGMKIKKSKQVFFQLEPVGFGPLVLGHACGQEDVGRYRRKGGHEEG